MTTGLGSCSSAQHPLEVVKVKKLVGKVKNLFLMSKLSFPDTASPLPVSVAALQISAPLPSRLQSAPLPGSAACGALWASF